MGCLASVFSGIGHFLKWSFTNGWKGVIVLLLVVALVWVGVCQCSKITRPAPTAGADREPTVTEAPYLVETFARYFYATRIRWHGDRLTMTRYWEQVGGSWHYFDILTIDEDEVGEINVSKR